MKKRLFLMPDINRGWLQCIFLLFLFLFAAPAQADETISYEAYLRLISHLRERARMAQTQPQQECAATLSQIATDLEAITAVRLPDSTLMSVDHQNMAAALRQQPCDPFRAERLLAGICPAALCPANAPAPPDGEQEQPAGEGVRQPGTGQAGPAGDDQAADGADGEREGGETAIQDQAPSPAEQPAGSSQPPQTDATGETEGADPAADSATPPAAESGAPPDGGETVADGETEATGEAQPAAPGADPSAAEGQTAAAEGENVGGQAAPGEGEQAVDQGEAADTAAQPGDGAAPDPGSQPQTGQPPGEGAQPDENGASEQATAAAAPDPENEQPAAPDRLPAWLWGLALAFLIILAGGILLWISSSSPEEEEKRVKAEPATPAEAVAEGRQLMAEKDYRAAVRRLFLAALLTLDEQGVIHFDSALTNYELLQNSPVRPSIAQNLAPVVATYERVWYGFEPLAATDYETLVDQIEHLKRSA